MSLLVAVDVIETAILPRDEVLGIAELIHLGILAVIRTMVSYFLSMELRELQEILEVSSLDQSDAKMKKKL